MTKELLTKKNQERQFEWDSILKEEFAELNELDKDMDLQEHSQLTPADKFRVKLRGHHVSTEDEYINGKTSMTFKCDVCGSKWDSAATKVVRFGCPVCRAADKNIEKARIIWLRSKQIIADKQGKIVKIPEQSIDHVTILMDKFGLKCGDCGGLFTFTHKKLRDDQWCPHCARLGSERPIRTSPQTYRRNQRPEDKFARICQVASIKGFAMESKGMSSKYRLTCSKCGEGSELTARQLCENKYPCRNKCLATHRERI